MTNTTNPTAEQIERVTRVIRGAHEIGGLNDPSELVIASLARAVIIAAGVAPQEPSEKCTCPSGDGSLRWPCPSHPPAPSPDREQLIAEARKAQKAVYLAAEKSVADDLARIIGGLADALAAQPVLDQGDYQEGLEEGIKIGHAEMKLDPEKVAEVLARSMPGWNDDTSEPDIENEARREAMEKHWERVNDECLRQGREYARAICEAAKRGELT